MVKIQTLRMSQQFQKRESLKDEDDSLEAAFKPRAASPYLHVMSLKEEGVISKYTLNTIPRSNHFLATRFGLPALGYELWL